MGKVLNMLEGDYLFNGYVWGETLWERCRICLKGIISSMDIMGRDTVEKVLNMLEGDYLINGYVWGETLWERCRICLKGIISSMDMYGERHCGKGVEYA